MSDYVIPGFEKFRSEGRIMMNPMNSVKISRVASTTSDFAGYGGGNPGWWERQTGELAWTDLQVPQLMPTSVTNQFELVSGQDVSRLTTEISTRLLSKIGRASTDQWENLAETRKTLAMLQSPVASWFRFDRKARIATSALSAANAWLVYRYGIRPLVGSTSEVLKALNQKLKPSRQTSRDTGSISGTSNDVIVYNRSPWVSTYRKQKTESHTIRAVSIDEFTKDLAYDLGFSAKSLMTLPWELVPYSFVVDWFANVSDSLGALAQAFSDKSLGRCHTHQAVYTDYRVSTDMSSASELNTLVSPSLSWCRMDIVTKSRFPWLPAPGLVFKSDFRLDDATRLSDAFALIGQSIARRFT
jgi:hypothetical protein